jgi:hypothetical protein
VAARPGHRGRVGPVRDRLLGRKPIFRRAPD